MLTILLLTVLRPRGTAGGKPVGLTEDKPQDTLPNEQDILQLDEDKPVLNGSRMIVEDITSPKKSQMQKLVKELELLGYNIKNPLKARDVLEQFNKGRNMTGLLLKWIEDRTLKDKGYIWLENAGGTFTYYKKTQSIVLF